MAAAGVAEAVEKATSQLLIMPDWDVNMQVRNETGRRAAGITERAGENRSNFSQLASYDA
jgi:hypothetical protein